MLVERFVYARAQRFIVLSEAFRSILIERYGIPEDRIRIVPGGVDVDRFAPAHEMRTAREGLGWPLDRPILLSVRRLVRRVGVETLLNAIPRVIQKVPNVCLLIAGKGPLAPTLQTFIVEHDLGHHVKLLGFVPDDQLPLAYRAADVSIVPTQALEGFGLVAVESLSAGTPALVTPVGGLPEVVRDLSPHLIMDGNDVESIARHLIDVLTGSVSLPSAEACRSFAVSRYSWPVIARQVRRVYEEVV
jgi:glycosyltransferase involved in cell wall biosynthesis